MYRHILRLIEKFAGDKAEWVLVVGGVALAAMVRLLVARSWRDAVRKARGRGGWRAVVFGLVNSLFRLAIGAVVVATTGIRGAGLSPTLSLLAGPLSGSEVYPPLAGERWGP